MVTAPGRDYVMTYHKPADSLKLLAKSFPRKEDRRVTMTLASSPDSGLHARQRQGARVGVDRMTEQSDLNSGKEWSKKDLFSLRNRIEHGHRRPVVTFLIAHRNRGAREGSRAWTHAARLAFHALISSPAHRTCCRSQRCRRRTAAEPRPWCGADKAACPKAPLAPCRPSARSGEVAHVDGEPHAVLKARALRFSDQLEVEEGA